MIWVTCSEKALLESSRGGLACRILVNLNVSHRAFFDAIPLDHLLMKYAASPDTWWGFGYNTT